MSTIQFSKRTFLSVAWREPHSLKPTSPVEEIQDHASLSRHPIRQNLRLAAQPPPWELHSFFATSYEPASPPPFQYTRSGSSPPAIDRGVGTTTQLVLLVVPRQLQLDAAALRGGGPLLPARGIALRLERDPRFLPALCVHGSNKAQRPVASPVPWARPINHCSVARVVAPFFVSKNKLCTMF